MLNIPDNKTIFSDSDSHVHCTFYRAHSSPINILFVSVFVLSRVHKMIASRSLIISVKVLNIQYPNQSMMNHSLSLLRIFNFCLQHVDPINLYIVLPSLLSACDGSQQSLGADATLFFFFHLYCSCVLAKGVCMLCVRQRKWEVSEVNVTAGVRNVTPPSPKCCHLVASRPE